MKHKHILYEIINNGFILTSIKFPIIPMISFITNMCLTIWFIHKNYKKTMYNLDKNISKKSTIKPDVNKNCDTIWNDIADKCETNIEIIFKDIVSDFQNDEINDNYSNPLSKHININEKFIEETNSKLKNTININLEDWREQLSKIKTLFSNKYTEVLCV